MDTEFYGKDNTNKINYSLEEPVEEAVHTTEQQVIGEKEILEASHILQRYKTGKANLEARVVQDELWWELRHWAVLRRKNGKEADPEPASAWLFNAILNKHADAMDNFPEPIVLPRERSDEKVAKTLSDVLPVILEYNHFEDVYAANWWEKLKHGTGVYGVFWNPKKENGLGDIDIKQIDLLNIFWEPGITDIQQSPNLFLVDLVDRKVLDRLYPEHKGEFSGQSIDVKSYIYDDTVDTSDKAVVVDWYYKMEMPDGRTVLHYAKYCNKVLLYASENEPEYRERGFYDHGQYPVVFDSLFPEKGTPVGFGYVAICKDPQMYIDKLSQNIMMCSMMGTRKRFMISDSTEVNETELLDWNKPLVHVSGELNDARVREIEVAPLAPIYQTVLDSKINELKETAANRDVSSGGSTAGITAASAIAALQEAGNKVSRDMIQASYRIYTKLLDLCIDLMRQFYDETRTFRITGETPFQYAEINNLMLGASKTGYDESGQITVRQPIFDLKTRAMRRSPFSRAEENERAKELYSMGFFAPEMAQQSMNALEMMEFEGIDKVREKVAEGQTLYNIVQQQQAQLQQMAGILQAFVGGMPSDGQTPAAQPAPEPARPATKGREEPEDSVMPVETTNSRRAQAILQGARA